MQDKEVEYYYWTGQPSELLEYMHRSVGQFHRNYKYVKIGITGAPERRFREHVERGKRYKWERMVVIYRTRSARNANAVEDHFIEEDSRMRNIWTGYSHMCEEGPYYAYLLLGNHRHYKV